MATNGKARIAQTAALRLATCLLVTAVGVCQGQELSCYQPLGVAPPPPKTLTVLMLDTTTPRDATAADSLSQLLQRILRKPGEQLVVVTFAGLAPGEFPRVVARAYQEPPADEGFRTDRVISEVEALDECLPKLWRRQLAALPKLVQQKIGSNSSGEFSELAYAMQWLSSRYLPFLPGTPLTRVLVYSDGLLHSRSGQSFYQRKAPRLIDAEQELARAQKDGLPMHPAPGSRSFDLYWLGLGAQLPEGRKYLAPRDVDALRQFWQRATTALGARSVHIDLAIPVEALR